MQQDLSGAGARRQTLARGPAVASGPWLAGLGVGVVALTAATPTLHWRLGGWVLIAAFAATGAAAYAARRLSEHADQRSALLIVLAAAAAMRLVLLFAEPYLSSDIYRYIWDGRVQAAGINPYRYVPNASELAVLRDACCARRSARPTSAAPVPPAPSTRRRRRRGSWPSPASAGA